MVYFILNRAAGAVKIGYSAEPFGRLATHQVSNADDLELLGCVEGGADLEKALHSQFDHLRVRGEWFEADPALMEYVSSALVHGEAMWSAPAQVAYAELLKMFRDHGPRALVRQDEAGRERFEYIKCVAGSVGMAEGFNGLRRLADAVDEWANRNLSPDDALRVAKSLDWCFDGIAGWWA